MVSLERRPFGLYYPSPELIMLKKYKSYRHWSALIKIVPHWISFFISYKKYMKSVLEKSRKVMGWKSTCLMSLYFKSEEDTMKNEISCRHFSSRQVRHSVRHAPSRGSARIQIINLRVSLTFFFLDDFILFETLSATKIVLFFLYHQDAVFERNLFHNGHKQ